MKKIFDAIASYFKELRRELRFVKKEGMSRGEAEERLGNMYDRMPRETRRRVIRKLREKGYDI